MMQRVRHIWAKPGQYVKIHRNKEQKPFKKPEKGSDEQDNTLYIVIGVVVLIWVLFK